jgi:hypothetical protein
MDSHERLYTPLTIALHKRLHYAIILDPNERLYTAFIIAFYRGL